MAVVPVQLENQRILITGATGFVAQPIVKALSADNTVYAGARFRDENQRKAVIDAGAEPVVVDLGADTLAGLPEDIDYVINLAVAKSGKWPVDMRVNADGLGRLLLKYKDVKSFLHFSSTAVYEYAGHEPRAETSPLGDNHRNLFETYSISKISAEAIGGFLAREFGIALTIARLNVPYGPFPCWPFFHAKMMEAGMPIDIHPQGPNAYSPIHAKDILRDIPFLLAAATCEVTTVNLAGSEVVTIEQWCQYISQLTGLEAIFNATDKALGSLSADTSRLEAIAGPSEVKWKDGFKQMLETMTPELLK